MLARRDSAVLDGEGLELPLESQGWMAALLIPEAQRQGVALAALN
jgi:hypothetical protein